MRLKTEIHILCFDCRWVGFKEELYLNSHSLCQVRDWVTLAPFLAAAELLHSSACCSWYAAFPDPEQDGSCHSPIPVLSLWPSRTVSEEVRGLAQCHLHLPMQWAGCKAQALWLSRMCTEEIFEDPVLKCTILNFIQTRFMCQKEVLSSETNI